MLAPKPEYYLESPLGPQQMCAEHLNEILYAEFILIARLGSMSLPTVHE
jgi:hypothetical protein